MSSSASNFELVDVIDLLAISIFITAGALLATSALISMLGSNQAAMSVRDAMQYTGGGLLFVMGFTRWLLSRFG